MAKAKKIDIKNVDLTEAQDNILTIQGEEDLEFSNLSEEIRTMLKEGSKVNIKITKARKSSGKPSTKKPIFKMVCPTCAKSIKTTVEDLKIECVECKVEYVLKEEN